MGQHLHLETVLGGTVIHQIEPDQRYGSTLTPRNSTWWYGYTPNRTRPSVWVNAYNVSKSACLCMNRKKYTQELRLYVNYK